MNSVIHAKCLPFVAEFLHCNDIYQFISAIIPQGKLEDVCTDAEFGSLTNCALANGFSHDIRAQFWNVGPFSHSNVDFSPSSDSSSMLSPLPGEIYRDLGRTFPSNSIFESRTQEYAEDVFKDNTQLQISRETTPGLAMLRDILHRFAVVRRRDVGYCQGVNYVVACLLQLQYPCSTHRPLFETTYSVNDAFVISSGHYANRTENFSFPRQEPLFIAKCSPLAGDSVPPLNNADNQARVSIIPNNASTTAGNSNGNWKGWWNYFWGDGSASHPVVNVVSPSITISDSGSKKGVAHAQHSVSTLSICEKNSVPQIQVVYDEIMVETVLNQLCNLSRLSGTDDMWRRELPRMTLVSYQLAELVRMHLPRVYEHILALEFDFTTLAAQWLIPLCSTMLPLCTLAHIWDILIFQQSNKILFRACLAFLGLLEGEILRMELSDFMQLLRAWRETTGITCCNMHHPYAVSFLQSHPSLEMLYRPREFVMLCLRYKVTRNTLYSLEEDFSLRLIEKKISYMEELTSKSLSWKMGLVKKRFPNPTISNEKCGQTSESLILDKSSSPSGGGFTQTHSKRTGASHRKQISSSNLTTTEEKQDLDGSVSQPNPPRKSLTLSEQVPSLKSDSPVIHMSRRRSSVATLNLTSSSDVEAPGNELSHQLEGNFGGADASEREKVNNNPKISGEKDDYRTVVTANENGHDPNIDCRAPRVPDVEVSMSDEEPIDLFIESLSNQWYLISKAPLLLPSWFCSPRKPQIYSLPIIQTMRSWKSLQPTIRSRLVSSFPAIRKTTQGLPDHSKIRNGANALSLDSEKKSLAPLMSEEFGWALRRSVDIDNRYGGISFSDIDGFSSEQSNSVSDSHVPDCNPDFEGGVSLGSHSDGTASNTVSLSSTFPRGVRTSSLPTPTSSTSTDEAGLPTLQAQSQNNHTPTRKSIQLRVGSPSKRQEMEIKEEQEDSTRNNSNIFVRREDETNSRDIRRSFTKGKVGLTPLQNKDSESNSTTADSAKQETPLSLRRANFLLKTPVLVRRIIQTPARLLQEDDWHRVRSAHSLLSATFSSVFLNTTNKMNEVDALAPPADTKSHQMTNKWQSLMKRQHYSLDNVLDKLLLQAPTTPVGTFNDLTCLGDILSQLSNTLITYNAYLRSLASDKLETSTKSSEPEFTYLKNRCHTKHFPDKDAMCIGLITLLDSELVAIQSYVASRCPQQLNSKRKEGAHCDDTLRSPAAGISDGAGTGLAIQTSLDNGAAALVNPPAILPSRSEAPRLSTAVSPSPLSPSAQASSEVYDVLSPPLTANNKENLLHVQQGLLYQRKAGAGAIVRRLPSASSSTTAFVNNVSPAPPSVTHHPGPDTASTTSAHTTPLRSPPSFAHFPDKDVYYLTYSRTNPTRIDNTALAKCMFLCAALDLRPYSNALQRDIEALTVSVRETRETLIRESRSLQHWARVQVEKEAELVRLLDEKHNIQKKLQDLIQHGNEVQSNVVGGTSPALEDEPVEKDSLSPILPPKYEESHRLSIIDGNNQESPRTDRQLAQPPTPSALPSSASSEYTKEFYNAIHSPHPVVSPGSRRASSVGFSLLTPQSISNNAFDPVVASSGLLSAQALVQRGVRERITASSSSSILPPSALRAVEPQIRRYSQMLAQLDLRIKACSGQWQAATWQATTARTEEEELLEKVSALSAQLVDLVSSEEAFKRRVYQKIWYSLSLVWCVQHGYNPQSISSETQGN